MNARVLLTGILIGVILALVVGAATGGSPQTGRYQIAASATPGALYVLRADTQTGAVELIVPNLQDRRAVDNLIQIIQPR